MAAITGFLPFSYGAIIASQKGGRIDVRDLTSEKTEEIFKKVTGFQQEGIINDLAVQNEKCETPEQRAKMCLAARLLVKMPVSDQQSFLMHLSSAHLDGYSSVQVRFAIAMETNSIVDLNTSGSGLTKIELARQAHYATALAKLYLK